MKNYHGSVRHTKAMLAHYSQQDFGAFRRRPAPPKPGAKNYYKVCPHCGAHIDPGERCSCTSQQEPAGQAHNEK